jgi:hypothetical protein
VSAIQSRVDLRGYYVRPRVKARQETSNRDSCRTAVVDCAQWWLMELRCVFCYSLPTSKHYAMCKLRYKFKAHNDTVTKKHDKCRASKSTDSNSLDRVSCCSAEFELLRFPAYDAIRGLWTPSRIVPRPPRMIQSPPRNVASLQTDLPRSLAVCRRLRSPRFVTLSKTCIALSVYSLPLHKYSALSACVAVTYHYRPSDISSPRVPLILRKNLSDCFSAPR